MKKFLLMPFRKVSIKKGQKYGDNYFKFPSRFNCKRLVEYGGITDCGKKQGKKLDS